MATVADVRDFLAERLQPVELPFPGKPDVTLGLRLLGEAETDEAKLAAQAYIKARGFDSDIDLDVYDRERVRQVLQRACVNLTRKDEHDFVQFFPAIEDLRPLDAGIITALWEAYADLVISHAPQAAPTDAELDQVVEALAGSETSVQTLLAHLPAESLRRVVRGLAARLRASTPAGGAGG